MKRLLILFLILLVFIPGATAQGVAQVDFQTSSYEAQNGDTDGRFNVNTFVAIMFFGNWINSSEPFRGNDSIIVSVGCDISTLQTDWIIESEFDPRLDCFWINFTYSNPAQIIFYIAEVLIDYRPLNFTQTADNVTLIWDQIIIQPTGNNWFPINEATLKLIGALGGAFAGVALVVVVYFKRKHDQYDQWQKENKSRKRKMQGKSNRV